MCKYSVLKRRHEKEFNAFPMAFAFSDKQFAEAMKKLGLEVTDTDKIYSAPGGGFYKKTDSKALHDLMDRHEKEMADAIASDKTGENFIFDMFNYELANHEFCITYDTEPTLDALGLSLEDIGKNLNLQVGLRDAIRSQFKE